jgi:hypothetical protein
MFFDPSFGPLGTSTSGGPLPWAAEAMLVPSADLV